jgi:hypothetical protein
LRHYKPPPNCVVLHDHSQLKLRLEKHFTPSFSFDRLIYAVFRTAERIAVHAITALRNELDHMMDHLTVDRHNAHSGYARRPYEPSLVAA